MWKTMLYVNIIPANVNTSSFVPQHALKEHDEKQLYLARQHLIDIRNIYAVISDILHKNINKIRAPKANNGVGLY